MGNKRSNAGPSNASHGQTVGSISGDHPVRAESGAIPPDNPASSINPHEDFADLMNIDFSQYIADDSDDVASMNSQSSPSIGMMSKTPFKTPAPSEFAEEPIELVSSPAPSPGPGGPQRLRDVLPGLGSSIEPSFAKDDSQKTTVLGRVQDAEPEPQVESRLRYNYSFSISSDDACDGPISPRALEAQRVEPCAPEVEENVSGKGKKTTRAQKPDPPKRAVRNKAVTGKRKSAVAKQNKAPVATTAKEATPPKRNRLARMLSVLSEPGSLRWEEPLVGSRVFRSPGGSDEGSSAQSGSPPNSANKPMAIPAAQKDTTPERVDKQGRDSPLTIPASFTEPVELSHPPECEGAEHSPRASPTKNQVSPIIRFGPDGPIDPNSPANAPPSKSPTKGVRKGRLSPKKRERESQRTVAPSKRRRVPEQAKKRVVRPKGKAKTADAHQEMEDGLTVTVADTDEPQRAAVPALARANSWTRVSETGSPSKFDVAGEGTRQGGRLAAQLTGVAEKGAVLNSPKSTTSATQPPVNLKSVFQAQVTRPRIAATQVDGPQLRREGLLSDGAKTASTTTVVRKGLTGKAVADEESQHKGYPSHAPHVPPVRQSPSLEAFRQRILCQLMSHEARQQDDAPPAENGGPKSPDEERGSGRTEPQHMLAGVLHAITERTLEFAKAKERDLYGIVEEYQSGATAFLDKVERLHWDENGAVVGLVRQQRQGFVQSCKAGSRVCSGFMARLGDRPAVSASGPSRLEGWLTQCRGMQRDHGAAAI